MADGYAFVHDPKRCVKCFTCELACKQWRDIPAGTFKLRKVYETDRGTFPDVTRTFHSVACQHCPDAPCIPACPQGAIQRREPDDVVTVEAAMCDGCRECVDACPFDVPDFDGDGVMQLCDLCADRLASGAGPFCVEVCPTGALRYLRDLGA